MTTHEQYFSVETQENPYRTGNVRTSSQSPISYHETADAFDIESAELLIQEFWFAEDHVPQRAKTPHRFTHTSTAPNKNWQDSQHGEVSHSNGPMLILHKHIDSIPE